MPSVFGFETSKDRDDRETRISQKADEIGPVIRDVLADYMNAGGHHDFTIDYGLHGWELSGPKSLDQKISHYNGPFILRVVLQETSDMHYMLEVSGGSYAWTYRKLASVIESQTEIRTTARQI